MKNILITLFLLAMPCGIATAQWTKVYQSDSCDCNHFVHSPLAGMGFFGEDSGAVCTEGDVVTGVTSDGGIAWKGSPMQTSFSTEITPSLTCGSTSYFFDVNRIWFCGKEINLCHTNDAGKTWEVDTTLHSSATLNCVYFIDSLTGFVGGYGQIYRTSDGGKNWQQSQVPTGDSGNFDVYQIQFCNPKIGLAICNDYAGLILRTTDSGITWALTTSPDYAGFARGQSLSYPDPRNAWFTDGIFLRRSTDSGRTWTAVGDQIPLGGQFKSISFLDSVYGVATASAGTSLIAGYTSDGGNNWQTTSIDSESPEGGFTSFPSLATAYVGGLNAVYRLVPGNLSVQKEAPVSTGASLISEDGNLFIVMPQAFSGRVRMMDALGRVLLDEMLSPGARAELPNFSPSNPEFRFADVECNGSVQFFKLLH